MIENAIQFEPDNLIETKDNIIPFPIIYAEEKNELQSSYSSLDKKDDFLIQRHPLHYSSHKSKKVTRILRTFFTKKCLFP